MNLTKYEVFNLVKQYDAIKRDLLDKAYSTFSFTKGTDGDFYIYGDDDIDKISFSWSFNWDRNRDEYTSKSFTLDELFMSKDDYIEKYKKIEFEKRKQERIKFLKDTISTLEAQLSDYSIIVQDISNNEHIEQQVEHYRKLHHNKQIELQQMKDELTELRQ